jgi:hypothetical protein
VDKYERFVASYLRLNGYFTVPNFIVHAGDDPERILAGQVGNLTETDIITPVDATEIGKAIVHRLIVAIRGREDTGAPLAGSGCCQPLDSAVPLARDHVGFPVSMKA